MNGDHHDKPDALYGTVEVVPIGDRPSALDRPDTMPTPATTARYIWRPPPGAGGEFPPDFSLPFDCITGQGGERPFVPSEGVPAFIPRAALGGYAILSLRTE